MRYWLQTLAVKAEYLLFYVFIFSIPFQRRIILFQKDWYFNEWRSISLFGTDILLGGLFLFWFIHRNRPEIKKSRHHTPTDLFLLMFLVAAGISVGNSSEPLISAYRLAKLGEFVLLYFYISRYARHVFNLNSGLWVLVASGAFQAILAISQFIKQSSLGLGFLGESMLRPSFQGVAVFFNSAGAKVMRAYGTTPHPNILAAFLMLAIFGLYYLYLNYRLSWKAELLMLAAYIVIAFGFLLTFSRTVIFAWLVSSMVLGFFNDRKKVFKIFWATLAILVLFCVIFWPDVVSRLTISSSDEAVSLRVYYAKQAFRVGPGHVPTALKFLAPVINLNWTGIGIGNFVNWFMKSNPHLPDYIYQPAHNIYLLVYSEMGILGISTFLFFLWFLIHQHIRGSRNLLLLAAFFGILFVGFFDHFLWTLQEGQIIFWLTASLIDMN